MRIIALISILIFFSCSESTHNTPFEFKPLLLDEEKYIIMGENINNPFPYPFPRNQYILIAPTIPGINKFKNHIL